MRKILFILLFSIVAYTGFGQGFAQEQSRTRSIPYIKNQNISISGYLVWHGDTIDFSDLIDSMVLRVEDSTKYVTPTALNDSLAALAGGHDILTLDANATLAGMYLNEQVLGMLQAGSAQNGWLSWEDWVRFNQKLSWVYHDSTLIGEGTFTNPLRVDTSRFLTELDNTGDWQGTWFGHDTAYFITIIEDDAFSAAWDGDMDAASKNAIYDYLNSLSFGVTDLSNTATPTYITVHSSTGTDTNLPLATQINAGLLSPEDKAKLDTLNYPVDTIYVIPDNTFPIEWLNYTANGEEITITDIPKPDGLYSGGIVTWQTGLTFAVGPAAYYIDGTLYTSGSTTLTLTAADATNSRFDLFVVDTLGVVSYITGTPSVNPQTPQYDLSSQLPLTSVLILANATEPSDPGGGSLVTEVVYDENVEWTTGYSGVVTDFNQTTTVFYGSVAAESYTINSTDYIYYVSDEDINTGTYETFSFWLKLKEALWQKDDLVLQFFWNGVPVSDLIALNYDYSTTEWQNIAIDLSIAAISTAYFDEIRIINDLFKSHNPAGFYTDYVKLQGGIDIPQTVGDDWGDQVVVSDETLNGVGTIGDPLKVDTTLMATKTDIDTLSANVRDSLLVHRTEIEALKDSITEHRTELENVKDSIIIHRSEIETVKDSLLIHRTAIQTNIDSLIVHREQLDSIFSTLYLHDSIFVDLHDSITQVNIEINNLYDSITTINTDISNLYDSITNLTNDISNLYDSLTVVNVDIENLYDSITVINLELTNVWDTIIQNSFDIDNILDSLTVINNEIDNIELNVDGDNWGTQTVESDSTLKGDGTIGNKLGVDIPGLTELPSLSILNSGSKYLMISDGTTHKKIAAVNLHAPVFINGIETATSPVYYNLMGTNGVNVGGDANGNIQITADTTELATKYDIDTTKQYIDESINVAISLITDRTEVDSLKILGTTLFLYYGDSTRTVDLASLQDGTGTDAQALDVAQLTGTNLELSISNDGEATHSIDLSPLQDGYEANTDDQTIDVFSISGNDIQLSIESDGEATKTVDISTTTAVAANTAKETNATHTGEVTGATELTIADDVVDYGNVATTLTDTIVDNDLSWDFSGKPIIYSSVTGGGTIAITNAQVNKTICVVLTISSFTSVTVPSEIVTLNGSADFADGSFYIYIHCIGTNLFTMSVTQAAS